ncbi:hypothetical protein NDI44_02480 [Trichocoleus sp. DQ-A3]|uniref:hypothetical protein n=1 Tax=Coleofasciculus sp. FACHB-125 TaxID=2692784 RepID=UPI001688C974|nr:hypothetical protein [Coleofasciculus sp. FACHB-125]MBD1901724.1 hypothetical protein [Coleofasciculus sp. FACHB-125]
MTELILSKLDTIIENAIAAPFNLLTLYKQKIFYNFFTYREDRLWMRKRSSIASIAATRDHCSSPK